MKGTIQAALLAVALAGAAPAATPIPEPPGPDVYVHDLAGLLDEEAEAAVAAPATDALLFHQVPVQVVVVDRSRDFGSGGIELLARQWFDEWRLGPFGLEGGGDPGILFLVAVKDRRARIELGGDWGTRWDRHARRIMDEAIVPRFKVGDYEAGLREGTAALLEMAKAGPDSPPSGSFLDDLYHQAEDVTALSRGPFRVAVVLSGLLLLAGLLLPPYRWLLIGLGLTLFFLILFTKFLAFGVLLFLIPFAGAGRSRWWSSSSPLGGGFSGGLSGGFSGGGFSGGGATGSW